MKTYTTTGLDREINDYLLAASGHLKESKGAIDGRKLAAYGVAASSALAMMSQAEAAVMHNPAGSTARPVTVSGGAGLAYASFDIDGDGNNDFALFGSASDYTSAGLNGTRPGGNNSVVGTGNLRKLSAGYSIGAGASWQTAQDTVRDIFVSSGSGTSGWNGTNGETGLVGVRFNIGANNHYGWIRLQIDNTSNGAIRATEWAYEACPNTAIQAGATTGGSPSCASSAPTPIPVMGAAGYGLTSLALGALGLGGLRRRRQEQQEKAGH